MKYDVVIIGSGLGGLVCGSLLSKAGKKVLVLEKARQPGGCMQSYIRSGLRFDTGLHYVGGLAPGQSLHQAFKELGLLELPWKRMDAQFDHIILGNQHFSLTQGYDAFVEGLAQYFPDYRTQLNCYVEKLQHITPEDRDINAYQWLKENLQDDTLIDVVSAPAMKIELRKESLPLFSFLHANRSFLESSWRLEGDGGMIVEKLIGNIRSKGGEVRCGCGVKLVKEHSVVCANGQEYEAEDMIADIHPTVLCELMEEKLKHKCHTFIQRMNNCENTSGIFTTSLVLKAPLRPSGTSPNRGGFLQQAASNGYVYEYGVWKGGKCVMISPHTPTQLDLLTPVSWQECLPWEHTSVGRRGKDYEAWCQQKVADSIHLAERFIPSLGNQVERIYTSSPLTYRDYLSIPQGSAFGIRKDYRASMLTYNSVRTPINHLYLTGQNVVLPGLEGVTMTAFETCRHLVGTTYIDNILNK